MVIADDRAQPSPPCAPSSAPAPRGLFAGDGAVTPGDRVTVVAMKTQLRGRIRRTVSTLLEQGAQVTVVGLASKKDFRVGLDDERLDVILITPKSVYVRFGAVAKRRNERRRARHQRVEQRLAAARGRTARVGRLFDRPRLSIANVPATVARRTRHWSEAARDALPSFRLPERAVAPAPDAPDEPTVGEVVVASGETTEPVTAPSLARIAVRRGFRRLKSGNRRVVRRLRRFNRRLSRRLKRVNRHLALRLKRANRRLALRITRVNRRVVRRFKRQVVARVRRRVIRGRRGVIRVRRRSTRRVRRISRGARRRRLRLTRRIRRLPARRQVRLRERNQRIRERLRPWHRVSRYAEFWKMSASVAAQTGCVAIASSDLPGLVGASIAARRLGVPHVHDCHELYLESTSLRDVERRILAPIERRYMHRADEIIFVNESIRAEYARRYGVDGTVVRNCAELPDSLVGHDLRSLAGLDDDVAVVLYQGGFTAGRGLDVVIDSVAGFPENAALVMLGYGPLRDVLAKQVVDGGLDGRVHILDAVPPDELLGTTATATIGLVPYQPISMNNRLALPNKIFEYTSVGLPVIAADIPELRRIIDVGCGLVYDPFDPEALAAAVREVLDPEALARMSATSRAWGIENSWKVEQQLLLRRWAHALTSRHAR